MGTAVRAHHTLDIERIKGLVSVLSMCSCVLHHATIGSVWQIVLTQKHMDGNNLRSLLLKNIKNNTVTFTSNNNSNNNRCLEKSLGIQQT